MSHLHRTVVPCLFLVTCTGMLALTGACSPAAPRPITPPESAPVATVAIPSAPTATATASEEADAPKCVDEGRDVVAGFDDLNNDFLKGPGDPSKPVAAACEKAQKRLEKAIKDGPKKVDNELAAVGKCFPSPRGAWLFDPGKGKLIKPDPNQSTGAGWAVGYALTYVSPDGSLVKSATIAGDVIQMELPEHHGLEARAVYDFDGDGVSEIIYSVFSDYGEESDFKISIVTFKDGQIKPYSPADGIEIKDVRDVDRDGRPDLITDGPFTAIGPCGLDGQVFHAPPHVAHSVAGGQFKQDDVVAQAMVRVGCGPLMSDLVAVYRDKKSTSLDAVESTIRIACARIYGLSTDVVKRRVQSQYPFTDAPNAELPLPDDAPGYCFPLRVMLSLAEEKPLFTTTPLCGLSR